jgi:uncharacterized protein (DUF1684 family)
VTATLAELAPAGETDAPTSGPGGMPLLPVGRLAFTLHDVPCTLTVFWIDVYGGGLFLPFRDATARHETYGGGRYLVDTVKGSDFPRLERTGTGAVVTVDFNYAYNPSCAYHHRWVCPLAPPENTLPVAANAGELAFHAGAAR